MIEKLKQFSIKKVRALLSFLIRKDLARQFLVRKEKVSEFVYEHLRLHLGMSEIPVIEDGKYNYYALQETNEFPLFHFVVPNIPLYIYVGDIRSASWPEARSNGVSREDWETEQLKINAMYEYIPELATSNLLKEPVVLVFDWERSLDLLSLNRLMESKFPIALEVEEEEEIVEDEAND